MSLPRYPEYKDSRLAWLGELPAHWAAKPLKAAASINDDTLPETTHPDFEMSYVDIGNVSLEAGIDRTEDITFLAAPSRARRLVRDGDVIVSTVRTYLRAIAPIVRPPENMVVSTGFAVVRPGNLMDSGFAKYALQSQQFVDQVISRSTGVSYPAINASDLGRIELPCPPKEEQSVIAAFLDRETAKIDALIAQQEKLLALLAEKRQATISHAVTRGLNPNAPMKDSGIPWLGEVPAHWGVSPLRYVSRIGNGSTPNRDNPGYWADDGFPWLNSSVVNQDEVTEADRFVTDLALAECHLPIVEPPAILVGITGQGKTRGMAAPLMFKATINQHLAFVKPEQTRLTSAYLLRVLEMSYEYLRNESEGAGSTKGAITCDQLSRFPIPLPPLDEQAIITEKLALEASKFDELSGNSKRAIELLKERRSVLISYAVTGKIDVRDLAEATA